MLTELNKCTRELKHPLPYCDHKTPYQLMPHPFPHQVKQTAKLVHNDPRFNLQNHQNNNSWWILTLGWEEQLMQGQT
jgi:hypothetical protein